MAIQHLRSAVADSRPIAGNLADGQLALNYESSSPGVYFKDDNGVLVKVGPVHVGSTAPNISPSGSAGNAVGEQWLDTTGGTYVFKVWDGSAWRSEAAGGASVTTSDSAPVSPSDGDLWYDSVGGRLYVYYDDGDTSQWVDAAPQGGGGGGASVTISETAPVSPTAGDLWFDNTTTDARLYIYYDDGNTQQWIDAAPAGAGGGTSLWTQGSGTVTPATSTDLVAANGFKFPATQVASADANTLDDYEEGTWTPANSVTTLTNGASATYTKVGRFVYVNFDFSLATNASSSAISITGLPFTASSQCFGVMMSDNFNILNAFPFVASGSSAIQFQISSTSGGGRDTVAYSRIVSGGVVRGSICYIA